MLALFLAAALGGDPSFDEGVKLYNALEYEQAIFRFEEVAVRPSLPPDDKAKALVWLGLCYAGTGDVDAAQRNFRDALRADPKAALPPDVSPRVAKMFADEQTAAALAKPHVDERKPPPSPPPPTPPPPSPKPPPSASSVGAIAAVAFGIGALAAGTTFAVFAATDYAKATSPNTFQRDVQPALDATNAELTGAVILLPLGVALGAAGAVMFVLE